MNTAPAQQRRNAKKSKYRQTCYGWILWSFRQKRAGCKKKGIPFDIDLNYLVNQYEVQDGLCYYSKIKLEFGKNSLYSASLERLNPNLGYTKGNVVLASKAMNWAKNNASTAEFIEFLLDLLRGLSPYVRLETKIIDKSAKLPFRKRTTDAGYDIASIEEVIIPPHGTKNINTGIIVSPPDGYYFTIEGRSSLAMHGVIPFRGTIDATYQGHLMVALTNVSDNSYTVKAGDRIAQIVLHPIINADFQLVEEFSPVDNGRATCGFGSTGQ
jgi:dUTP pyrophosphatase